ncbi:MAG: GTPase Era [Firmicutes bacterium]|nr:GTPase Era [Bacillota bacterium]
MKSGFITVIGRPNVGKSTLLNQIMGEKLTITSNKPQTTRNSIQCIYTTERGQAVFIDTPGIHKPQHVLDSKMMEMVDESLDGIDLILVMVEPGRPREDDQAAIDRARRTHAHKILVINKTDMVELEKVAQTAREYAAMGIFDEIVPISAFEGTNVDELVDVVFQYLPEGPAYFPEDMVTDQPERMLVAEFIREKALYVLSHEVPHGIAVVIDTFTDRPGRHLVDINATIICEKASHKPIILGRQGQTIKKIGSQARIEIQKFLGTKVNLQLWVKVRENWRDNEVFVNNLARDQR